LLGGSSARADIQRGTVLTEEQRLEHANKLWPSSGKGGVQRFTDGAIGHYGSGEYPTFYVWRELRAEWVRDYSAVIECEAMEAEAWSCRQ
jgi:hypothetical protein